MKLRKMTDKQLVEEFYRAADADIAVRASNGVQAASDVTEPIEDAGVQKLLSALSEGKCKGIKGATVHKITKFATEIGLIRQYSLGYSEHYN